MSLSKICFVLGTAETLVWTTVSGFVRKTLRNWQINRQTNKEKWKGTRTEQIRKLRVLENLVLYTQLKELGVPRLQKVLKKDIMMFLYTKEEGKDKSLHG